MSKEAMNLIHEQLQKLWLLGDKAAELANPALDAMKALAEQPAQQQEPEYAWPTVADYERDVGFQTNEAFRIAWNMARTTNRMLGHTSSQPAQQEPVECKTLCELCVKRSYHFCANSAQTTLIPSPPAQRTWVNATTWRGLTDEEMSDLQDRCGISIHQSDFQAIEAKLKEKNTHEDRN